MSRASKIEEAARAFLASQQPLVRFDYNPNGPDLWTCSSCDHSTTVVYNPPGLLQACDEANFPHADNCPGVALQAALAARDDEPEEADDV